MFYAYLILLKMYTKITRYKYQFNRPNRRRFYINNLFPQRGRIEDFDLDS